MKLPIPIKCPASKHTMQVLLETMRPGAGTNCSRCGIAIRFTGDDGAKAQKALDDLTDGLRGFGR